MANVISYRPKYAVRDMAKALGYSPGAAGCLVASRSSAGARCGRTDRPRHPRAGRSSSPSEVLKFPRHLGIHSGGMVLTDRPVGEVVPIEHARMENRTVLQWDKDDCAWMGLVKFDLLGLGMLAALQYCFDLVREHDGRGVGARDPAPRGGRASTTCSAGRTRSACSRWSPARRWGCCPGCSRAGSTTSWSRSRSSGPVRSRAARCIRTCGASSGEEPVTYPHPKLEPVLERTLGVPLFQEQLMQMAMAVGGCTAEDADLLRRAMGSKRGIERIDSLKAKLYAGMARQRHRRRGGRRRSTRKIEAFANFGFAESHSLSFGLLVYASSWLKLHYPAAFLAALLRAQPMGFYSPQTLVADARRHGVEVLRPDILRSGRGRRS